MPLVRVSLRRGKSAQHIAAIRNSIYRAMIESFNVPQNDRFIVVHQHDAEEFDYDPNYLDIARTDELVMIQIACNNTRTVEQKKAFYQRTAELLSKEPGLRPQDVLINLLETGKENWSFGNGQAPYA
ncbi:tautomerase family protein [Dyella kyungheensis]|uniref:tautomerase family protein n=1 Tax=Dyella kyungheensis TaxID=1242174 RepID=UPI003CEFB1D2